jgi:fermentation-respiration switch protein FrsA (DUF1100 family)
MRRKLCMNDPILRKENKKMNKEEKNTFGLVYDGALEKNEAGKVNIHQVRYLLHGLKIAANVYTPAGYDEKNSYPAVVVAHPNGGVKEQVAGLYAQRLAELGYVTMAFDASYQGQSEGEPRNTDRPQNRVEDIHGALDYIVKYPGVDRSRVGALGICGGGAYTLRAAQTDKRIRAVATLSAFNTGIVRKNGFLDSQIGTIAERLEEAYKAREQELSGGEVLYTPNMLDTLTPEQAKELPFDLYREGYEYYGNRCKHTGSSFSYTVSSNIDLFAFDARVGMEMINQPLLMMAGKMADTLYMTEGCYERATGTKNKELFLIDGAHHIQTYYVPEYVDQAVNRLKEFFGSNL